MVLYNTNRREHTTIIRRKEEELKDIEILEQQEIERIKTEMYDELSMPIRLLNKTRLYAGGT